MKKNDEQVLDQTNHKTDEPKHKDDFIKDLNEPVEKTDLKLDPDSEVKGTNEVSLFNPPAENQNNGLLSVDMNSDLPDLDDAEISPLDLSMNYWTPQAVGESKKVYFSKIGISQCVSKQNPDVMLELPSVFMYTKSKEEGVKAWINGSVKLVTIMETNDIKTGTPLLITYLGKKPTRKGNQLDDWSVKPLILKM